VDRFAASADACCCRPFTRAPDIPEVEDDRVPIVEQEGKRAAGVQHLGGHAVLVHDLQALGAWISIQAAERASYHCPSSPSNSVVAVTGKEARDAGGGV